MVENCGDCLQAWVGSGECCGVEAEWLALVGGQRRPVALKVSRYTAAGGARAVAESLNASLTLELCCTHRHRER